VEGEYQIQTNGGEARVMGAILRPELGRTGKGGGKKEKFTRKKKTFI